MKNYLLIVASVLGLGLLSGCSDSVTDSITGGTSCVDTYYCANDNSTMETCCSSSSCSYETGTRSFSCNGTDCYSAADSVATFCLSKTASKAEFDLASKLGLEKADNIVLKKSIDDMYIDLGNEVQK
ncbi:MAG: hypothetical protein OQK98_05415 [Gammaproteobacteria bacterium]|nr:hypothetical protein [Gammaproteobacteria bacterium]